MANTEDFDEANEGAPAADIPNLKKKEKDRKKAGVTWSSGAKPGGAFSGATGGTVARAAASAVVISGEAAAIGAGGIFGISTTMAAAGVGALLIGATAAGYMMFRGGGARGTAGPGNLGALASSLKIRGGGGDRTGYVASKGEIAFEPVAASKIEAAPEKDPAQGESAAVKEGAAEALPDWRQAGLGHNLSGTKLSSSFGESFGGKNIFSGNSGAPKLNNAIGKVNIPGGQAGKLSGMRNGKTGRLTQGVSGSRSRASKAFGQLKVAKGLSMAGAGTSAAEGARTTAGAAFDGEAGNGNVSGGPGMPDAATAPNALGGGAPDMTAPNVNAPNGVGSSPNLAALNGIGAMAKQAASMKKNGIMLMAVGALLMAAGVAMMPLGTILVAIGAMILGMGIMMMQMSSKMKNMADTMSQDLAARTGNINQNATNQYCIDKAYNEGTDPQNCNPPDSVTQGQKFDAATNPEIAKHKEMVRVDGQVDDANGSPIAP